MKRLRLPRKIKKRLPLLIGVIAGAVIGALCAVFDAYDTALLAFLFLFPTFFLQLILHEGGHLIGGLLSGYRFESFRVGPLILLKQDGKYRLRILHMAGTGGQCLLIPPDCAPEEAPYLVYHAAGSAMNLLSALLHAFLLFEPGALRIYGACMLFTGLYLGLTNGIPMRVGTLDNDGMNIRNMRKDPALRVIVFRQLQINAAMSQGLRLDEMPEEWFAAGEYRHLHGVMLFSRLMDQGRYEEALQYGLTLAYHRKINFLHRGMVQSDLETLRLLLGKPAMSQSEMLRKYRKAMKSDPSVLRAQYVKALLKDDDPEAAEKYLARFEKAARQAPHESGIAPERELIDAARARYETKQQNLKTEA